MGIIIRNWPRPVLSRETQLASVTVQLHGAETGVIFCFGVASRFIRDGLRPQ